jgi:DNA repair protein RecO (recombination protein O)
MSSSSTPAIVLRRTEYGDDDLIVALFTLEHGKQSVMAKYAKRSTKRFAGVLELFSEIKVVYATGRRKGMPVLQEAILISPFAAIRADIKRTAYASYWAEVLNNWMETRQPQVRLYGLIRRVLADLDAGLTSAEQLNVLFQMRFLALAGLAPNLTHCVGCGALLEQTAASRMGVDLARGGLVCSRCAAGCRAGLSLSKGTVKQLRWIGAGEFHTAARMRFSPPALQEGQTFLETFVPYHLGRNPKSLTFLKQLRRSMQSLPPVQRSDGRGVKIPK